MASKPIESRSDYVIALGGNLPSGVGDPAATLTSAVAALTEARGVIRAVSRFYATPCFPAGAGPDFVNAAVLLSSPLDPEELIALLHRIEADHGRTRATRWGARNLDLDLLSLGDAVLPSATLWWQWHDLPLDRQAVEVPDSLILPHPRLQDRAFVLVPMADVAPDWRHPVLGRTVSQMLTALPPEDVAAVIPL